MFSLRSEEWTPTRFRNILQLLAKLVETSHGWLMRTVLLSVVEPCIPRLELGTDASLAFPGNAARLRVPN